MNGERRDAILRDRGSRGGAGGIALATAILPLAALGAFHIAGPNGLYAAAAAQSGAALVLAAMTRNPDRFKRRDPETGLPERREAVALLRAYEASGDISGRRVAVVAAGLEDPRSSSDPSDNKIDSGILREAGARITRMTRQSDLVVRLSGSRFAVVLGNLQRADLQMMMQIAARLRSELSHPFESGGQSFAPIVSMGFCLPNRSPDRTGPGLLAGAEHALSEARTEPGGAIRAYRGEIGIRDEAEADRRQLSPDAPRLEAPEPRFQPQIELSGGKLSGMAAMPDRNSGDPRLAGPEGSALVPDGQTLHGALGEVLVSKALSALAGWDRGGHPVPGVSVRLGMQELRHPGLVNLVRWHLDGSEIAPARLTVELDEGNLARSGLDHLAAQNLEALSRLGCKVDIAGFVGGSAARDILRRAPVGRLKIGRELIAGLDRDPDARRLIRGKVALARELGVPTLVEGVDTAGELEAVAALGCDEVQGMAVAGPMDARGVATWLRDFSATAAAALPPQAEDRVPGPLRNPKTA